MRGLLSDLRHATRIYLRTPVASSFAILALAVAMAFVSAFLSLYIDMIRPHSGFEPGGRLITVIQTDGVFNQGVRFELIERVNEEMTSIDSLSGLAPLFEAALSFEPDSDTLAVAQVTSEFFPSLRPRMVAGRGFQYGDHLPDSEPVVVISDRIWRTVYEADSDVIGTTVDLYNQRAARDADNATVTARIVGVLTPNLADTSRGAVDLWVPYESFAPIFAQPDAVFRSSPSFWTFFRKNSGVSVDAVLSELNSRYLDAGLEVGLFPGYRLDGIQGVAYDIGAQRRAHEQLRLFLGGSILLALVAGANSSLFLLARAPGRRRELGVRMSVGAPLKRIGRQLVTEAGLLVVLAAGLGLVFSVWITAYLRGLVILEGVEWRNVSLLDWRVLGLVALVAAILTILVSLAPVNGLRRLGIAASSRQVAARATAAQRIAGAAQVAVACTFGGAAVAFAWYLGAMIFGDPGFRTRDLHLVRLIGGYNSTPIEGGGFMISAEELTVNRARQRQALLAMPEVRDVSFTEYAPGPDSRAATRNVPHPVDPSNEIAVEFASIDHRYVDLLGLSLLRGRAPAENEIEALVNQSLAEQIWGREDVVGEVLFNYVNGEPIEIVGVLEDLPFHHPRGDVVPIAFTSGVGALPNSTVLVDSPLSQAGLQQALQALYESGELGGSLGSAESLDVMWTGTIAADRIRGLLTITTAAMVVLLAAFGFYGTQRYLVSAGRREYAIRASLGAGPRALGRLVIARGLLLSLPGLVIGGFLSFILVGFLRDDYVSRDVLPGVVTIAVVAGLTMMLLIASLGPARQARRTQPAPLLKED